ncbi:hypothetical protein Tco_0678948 [Tanacetum coccineum]|uniref:Secreted protein n=1 Tax=Tanacetum coccineum TaxID=301880 RepID=A0ABQ4XGH7_9ASTR
MIGFIITLVLTGLSGTTLSTLEVLEVLGLKILRAITLTVCINFDSRVKGAEFEVTGLDKAFVISTLGRTLLSKSPKFLKARWRFFLALTKRTSESWMFRVSTSIPLDKLKMSRIFEASRARSFCPSITRASHSQLHLGIPIS